MLWWRIMHSVGCNKTTRDLQQATYMTRVQGMTPAESIIGIDITHDKDINEVTRYNATKSLLQNVVRIHRARLVTIGNLSTSRTYAQT